MNDETPVFTVTQAAVLAGMHPQTLRQYDRLGLVVPQRTAGRGRRYSQRDVASLLEVQHMAQADGINLAGIKRIMDLERKVSRLQRRLEQLTAAQSEQVAAQRRVFAVGTTGDDVVVLPRGRRPRANVSPSAAVVLWQPRSYTTPYSSR